MSIIAALDSSGKTAGVCLLQNGIVCYEKTLARGLTHSETLLPLFEEALAACGFSPREVDVYAVTAGPGSFTGLRIGMALVKGLALVHGTPAIPVSTLEALAMAVEFDGTVLPALDARRGEVYWAAFDRRHSCARLCPDSAGPAGDITNYIHLHHGPTFLVGDGAEICYTILTCGRPIGEQPLEAAPAGSITLAPADFLPPIARGAAFLAYAQQQAGILTPATSLHPVYLRLSQAERIRQAGNTAFANRQ